MLRDGRNSDSNNVADWTALVQANVSKVRMSAKLYTKSDRTSCHRWQANQFRLFLHTGAYWLLLLLRSATPKRSQFRAATFETIRRTFLKIAVRVEQLKTRIKIAFPTACPQRKMLVVLMGRIKAQSP